MATMTSAAVMMPSRTAQGHQAYPQARLQGARVVPRIVVDAAGKRGAFFASPSSFVGSRPRRK